MDVNVCNATVLNDFCSGCGVCAALCPVKTLEIQFNGFGEYNAVDVSGACNKECRLCLQVCPFSDDSPAEDIMATEMWDGDDSISRHEALGYFRKCYCGHVADEKMRLNSASGGLLTWLLETILQEHLVDYVVCVKPCQNTGKLFEFAVCSTPEEVRECSRSCYYPVEISSVINYVKEHNGKYAVTGLPCVIKGLRLACRHNKTLDARIMYAFGLVCGQQKSKFFAEYICSLGGSSPNELSSVKFRVKDAGRPASDFGLAFTCKNSHTNTVYWTEGMAEAWCNRYFTLNACNYCDDLFAELADASFMDAWLPQYSRDFRGTSIAIVRNERLQSLFEEGIRRRKITADGIDAESVVRSQSGALEIKREGLAKRLDWALRRGKPVLNKRVKPKKDNFLQRLELDVEHKLWRTSKQAFLTQKTCGPGLCAFEKEMRRILLIRRVLQRVLRTLEWIKRKFFHLEKWVVMKMILVIGHGTK